MTTRRLAAMAIIALAISLGLGWIDYETRTVADLFDPGNVPALAIFAAIAFTLLLCASLAVEGTLRAIRTRRSPR